MFVQRSNTRVTAAGNMTLAAHGSAQVGDLQVLALGSHTTVTCTTPTGFTLISTTSTAHHTLRICTRILKAEDLAASVVSNSNAGYSRMWLSTYRGFGVATVAGQGTGLVHPSRTIGSWLLRITASAQNNISGGGSKTMTANAGLSNGTAISWNWFDGMALGDEPGAAGTTAPSRTTSQTGSGTMYPQWLDLELSPLISQAADDTLGLADELVVLLGRGLDDPVGPTEDVALDVTLGRVDNFDAVDAAVPSLNDTLLWDIVDGFSLSDAEFGLTPSTLRLADTLAATDANRGREFERLRTESLNLTDAAGKTIPHRITDGMELTDDADGTLPPRARLDVLTPTVYQSPTSVNVSYVGGFPETDVDFLIDGIAALTYPTDSTGAIAVVSVPVAEGFLAGIHTVSAEQVGATPASGIFTIEQNPVAAPVTPAADTPPSSPPPPPPLTVTRWVLQDPAGVLPEYTFEQNPSSWVEPRYERVLASTHTTAHSGQFHITEGYPNVTPLQFTGLSPSQAMLDALRSYHALNRRFYLFDHRGRAWLVTFTSLDARPRRRSTYKGVMTDWLHDYTVIAECYSQEPVNS